MHAIDEIVAEFLVETSDMLDRLDRDLRALERSPESPGLLAGVFRTVQTIKGTSGFLALHDLERLTRAGQNLLGRVRDGRITLTGERSAALLRMVDAARVLLATIERTGAEGDTDHSALLRLLSGLLEDDGSTGRRPVRPHPSGEVLVSTSAAAEDAIDPHRDVHGTLPALIIVCAGTRYAIGRAGVRELVRLSDERECGGLELIAGAPVYRLRDRLVHLIRLDEQLGLVAAATAQDVTRGDETGGCAGLIVVLHIERQCFGLVVDDVADTQDIVVRPLGRHLKGIPVYAGATILDDGAVAMILDVAALARRSNVLAGSTGVASSHHDQAEPTDPVFVAAFGRAHPRGRSHEGAVTQLGTFVVGRYHCGVDQRLVREVVRLRRLTPVPLAPPAVAGLVDLRGEVLTVIDARAALGLPPAGGDGVPVDVVVLADDEPVGLRVDEVAGVVEVTQVPFAPTPGTVRDGVRDLLHGVYTLPDRLLLALAAERVLDIGLEPRP